MRRSQMPGRLVCAATVAALAIGPAGLCRPIPSRALKAHVIPTTGDLQIGDLLEILARRMRFLKRADAFSPDLDESAFVGRTIRIVRPLLATDNDSPTWSYNIEAQDLSLSLQPDYESVEQPADQSFFGLVLARSSRLVGTRIRQMPSA